MAPTDGYVTRIAHWLDTTGGYANRDLTYDGWGNLTQDKDPTGVATNFTVDSTYHLFAASTYVIPAETTSYLWDAVCSQPSQQTNPNNQVATSQYDTFCRPYRTDGPLSSFQITTYPDFGNPQLQNVLVETPPFDPNDGTGNYRERRYFDGFGRTWRAARKAPNGGIYADTTYTARGTVAAQTAPYYWASPVYMTTYSYDAMDRRTETRFPDNATASTAYGLWEETRTDPEGHDDIWRYDAYGRVISKEPEGHLSSFQYDLLGHMVGMTDPGSNDWTWEYDSLGRMTEQHDTDSGLTTLDYDLAGRLRFRTDAKGQQTQSTYSTQTGRLMTKSNAAGTVQYTYSEPRLSYYNVGQLTTVTDPASSLRFDYDAAGRPTHASRTIDSATYDVVRVFDAGARVRSINYPDGDSISGLTYDTANRLKSTPGVFTNADYDASDRPTSRSNVNGTVTTWTYDPQRSWLDSIVTTGPSGTIQNLQYSRNGDGLVEGVTSPFPDEGWSYGYNAWHQLTSVSSTSNPLNNQSFQYDDTGGITYNSLVGSYLYQDPAHPHAPSSMAAQAYSYDPNGNLLMGGGRAITWDANNLPTSVVSGASSTSFTYDGLGTRLKSVSGSTTSRYPFADDYEVSNGIVTKYISVEGMGVVAKRTGPPSVTYWLHTDRLGSIQALTDAAGAEVQRRTYRAYGDKIAETTSHIESRGYIDQRQDPGTGLTYLHARYYDSRAGVFLSPDRTLPAEPGAGPSRYSYALGNPVAGSDRSGLMTLCGVMGGSIDFNSASRFADGPWTIHITLNLTVDCTNFDLGPFGIDRRLALQDRDPGRPGSSPGSPTPPPGAPPPAPTPPPSEPPAPRPPDTQTPDKPETAGLVDGMERAMDEQQQASMFDVFAPFSEARSLFPNTSTLTQDRQRHCYISCIQIRRDGPMFAFFPSASTIAEFFQLPSHGIGDFIGDVGSNVYGSVSAFDPSSPCEGSCETSPFNRPPE